ncbi:MAG TPA: hypothetical protein QF606_03555, partial [Anaerolineales bacterium]|nr:hypothetical protein [Anaerolineales bacterium]
KKARYLLAFCFHPYYLVVTQAVSPLHLIIILDYQTALISNLQYPTTIYIDIVLIIANLYLR